MVKKNMKKKKKENTGKRGRRRRNKWKILSDSTLEATQVQIDGFFSQLPYKCHRNRMASVRD